MNRKEDLTVIKIEDYPLTRVPQDRRVSFLSVAIVHMGMLTALDQFMLGAVLGNSMTLIDAFTAIFVGSLIFGVVTYGLGLAGMREGISGSLLARLVRLRPSGVGADWRGGGRQPVGLVRHSERHFRQVARLRARQ